MKETRTINLNGLVFNIDYDAYQSLRDYLQDIEIRLPMDEKADVMSDLEARMSELFQKALFAKNIQVIDLTIVNTVKAQIGSPSEFGENKRPKVKKAKSQNSGCGRVLGITVIVLLAVCALPILLPLLAGFLAVIIGLFGASIGILGAAPALGIELFGGNVWQIALFIVCGLAAIALPVVMIICSIVSYMRTRRGPKPRFWWIVLILWVLSLVGTGTLLVKTIQSDMDIPSLINVAFDNWDGDDEGMASEVRDMPAFHSVNVSGAADVDIHIAPDQQLSVRSNILSEVLTEVRDSILYVEVPSARYSAMKLDVTLPELRAINAVGACDIEAEDVIRQQTFTIECAGAAKVELPLAVQMLNVSVNGATELDLEGSADKADISLAGAGKIDAKDLLVQSMHINCAGASKAEVNVTNDLWAQATGASKIQYKGTPSVKQKITVGGSTISKY